VGANFRTVVYLPDRGTPNGISSRLCCRARLIVIRVEETGLFVASEHRCTRVTNSSVIRIVWMVLESVFFLLVRSFLRLLRCVKAPKTINFLRQTLLVLSDASQIGKTIDQSKIDYLLLHRCERDFYFVIRLFAINYTGTSKFRNRDNMKVI
jgi:hypothetical protein